MNILIATVNLEKKGGVASYYRSLLKYYDKDTNLFTVGARDYNNSFVKDLVRMMKDYFNFAKRLKNSEYDVVHLNPSLGSKAILRDSIFLLLAKIIKQHKVLVFIHGWDVDCEKTIRKNYLPIFRGVYFRADAFIVLSQEFKQKLIEMGCHKPIFIESTTVDDEIFSMSDSDRITRNNNAFSILYLSRVEKDKGIYEALDAYHLLKVRCPKARMTVAGDGSELGRVRQYAATEGMTDIEFTGYIRGDDKHKAFTSADVYIFPTTYGEGMPTTVLEAMAYGLPVITRAVGGLSDFFEDGKMGFITESRDPAVFADLLERLSAKPQSCYEIGRYNQSYANVHFAASNVARRIQNIYRALIYGTENNLVEAQPSFRKIGE